LAATQFILNVSISFRP